MDKKDAAKIIAAIVVLGGAGVVLYLKLGRDANRPKKAEPDEPPEIDPVFAKKVADALVKVKQLRPADVADHRHRYFFMHRRAFDLGMADHALVSGPGLATLQDRVGKEYDLVANFVDLLLGTTDNPGPYAGGPTDPDDARANAPHLDLGTVIHQREIDPPPTTEQDVASGAAPNVAAAQTVRGITLRESRVVAIVWRAAAIEASLWSAFDTPAKLATDALTLLLDRRLRMLDRLRYQVNAGASPNGIGSTFIQGRRWQGRIINRSSPTEGPWEDQYMVRSFEAPSVPRTARSDDRSWDLDTIIGDYLSSTQTLTMDGDPTGGTFTLELDGSVTKPILFNATPVQVLNAAQLDFHLDGNTIATTGGQLPDDRIFITLSGPLTPGFEVTVASNNLTGGTNPEPLIGGATIDPALEVDEIPRFNVTGTASVWYRNHGTNELDWNSWPGTRVVGHGWSQAPNGAQEKGYAWVLNPALDTQSIEITGAPTGGSFTLAFNGKETDAIAFNATSAQMLTALSSILGGSQDFGCEGGPFAGTPIIITYKNPKGTSGSFAVGTVSLTGGTGSIDVLASGRARAVGDTPGILVNKLVDPVATVSGDTLSGRRDWWARSWLHSDGLLAALHLEALCHGLRRQEPMNGIRDVEFDAQAGKYAMALDDYFHQRRVTWVRNSIMQTGRTDYFENGGVPPDDLQVGDQVLFETNPALVALGTTNWDYPTVLVTDVDYSSDKPTIDFARVGVQGFGTTDNQYGPFQLLLVKLADAVLDGVRKFIPFEIDRQRAASHSPATFVPPTKLVWDIGVETAHEDLENDREVLRLWNPYDETFDPGVLGPWWIWINPRARMWQEMGVFGNDLTALLNRIPGALMWVTDTTVQFSTPPKLDGTPNAPRIVPVAPGFNPPPWEDGVSHNAVKNEVIFVPLFQPTAGWEGYFIERSHGVETEQSLLVPVNADSGWRPELARDHDDPALVRVIRPRPKP